MEGANAERKALAEKWDRMMQPIRERYAEWVEISGYAPGLTIDRIDPRGNYEPNNCQWLTRSENSKKQFEDRKARTKEMVEVVHGYWKSTGDPVLDNIYGVAVCSICGYEYAGNNTNYCPNCGAKMDGDGNA